MSEIDWDAVAERLDKQAYEGWASMARTEPGEYIPGYVDHSRLQVATVAQVLGALASAIRSGTRTAREQETLDGEDQG